MKNFRKASLFVLVFSFISFYATSPIFAANIFTDSFGSGSTVNDVSGWRESEHPNDNGDDVVAKQSSATSTNSDYQSPNGGRFIKIEGDNNEWICKQINVSGYQSNTLSYYWRGEASAEANDFGVVEIKANGSSESSCNSNDNGGWSTLSSHALDNASGESNQTQEAWALNTVNLPADNDGLFLLRFRNDSSADSEYFRIDGVNIDGTSIPTNATLTLNKVVINSGGGTAVANDFQAKIDGSNVSWGVAQTVSIGSHTASEVSAANYTAGTWGGDCASNGSITLTAGQSKTCTITNTFTPPQIGSITITKFVCPANTTVVRSANGVGGTVPAGCVPQSGKTFGYVHGTQTDANAPHPELSAPLTAGGSTNGSGVLTISNLPATGRYLVVETNGSNQKIPDGDILGLYCIGDGDNSNNNDNQEITFVPANGTVNCVAYNKAPIVPQNGKVHILKFINGVMATVESAFNASFPMITPTYGNAPFTLDSDGWTDGDAPYEASTSTIEANGTYTAYENTDTPLVGTNCDQGKPYALEGYSTGNTLVEAANNDVNPTAPTVTVNGDKYIIVWNQKCGEVEGASTIKVHIYKYLKVGEITGQVPDGYEGSPDFPMTSTWTTANLNGGEQASGSYVLGDNHGGTVLKYAADTSPMAVPADYTTSETTNIESDFLPIGSECVEGKYRLLGYKSSEVSLAEAESDELSSETPSFNDLDNDAYIIVVNEKCADDIVILECQANEAGVYVSEPSEGGPSAVTPHEAWTASIPDATWIYNAPLNEAGSSDTGDQTFTKTFTISGTPTDSTLDIAADNMYTVEVNGEPLETGTSGTDLDNFASADNWVIPASMLLSGSNTIEITVTNPSMHPETEVPFGDPNPAGLLYKLTINSKTCPVVEDPNNAPTANAGADQSITLPTSSATLNGSASTDGDGTISTYAWTFVSGPSNIDPNDEVSPTVSGLVAGTYVFSLVVTDNDSASSLGDSVQITVNSQQENNEGGGGGGGGSSSGSIPQLLGAFTGPVPQVLGASTTSCSAAVDKFLRRGYKNDVEAVKKLQQFLNDNMNAGLVVDGKFGKSTEKAVMKFQALYFANILTPWGLATATGIYYITTQAQITNILCPDMKLPIPTELIPFDENPLSPKKV